MREFHERSLKANETPAIFAAELGALIGKAYSEMAIDTRNTLLRNHRKT